MITYSEYGRVLQLRRPEGRALAKDDGPLFTAAGAKDRIQPERLDLFNYDPAHHIRVQGAVIFKSARRRKAQAL